MEQPLGKVTAFITRASPRGEELLLFEHPYAGIQVPAGTMEEGEMPEQAAVREAYEETGLAGLAVDRYLGVQEYRCPANARYMLRRATVYARPDPTSFDWATMRRGTRVSVRRRANGFTQVSYREWDRIPNRTYVSYQITGWVEDSALTGTQVRHFYRLTGAPETPDRWTAFTDNHTFTLFWAPLDALPEIIWPQRRWLHYLKG